MLFQNGIECSVFEVLFCCRSFDCVYKDFWWQWWTHRISFLRFVVCVFILEADPVECNLWYASLFHCNCYIGRWC
jgi:hypothetical protein